MIDIDDYLNYDVGYRNEYIKNNKELDADNLTSKKLYDCISRDVEIILAGLGVSPTQFGYVYWIDAVILYVAGGKSHMSMCNEIYPLVARKYGKSAMSVERAMRFCLERSLLYCSKKIDETIAALFQGTLMKPRNSKILVKIAETISSEEFQNNKQNFVKSFNI